MEYQSCIMTRRLEFVNLIFEMAQMIESQKKNKNYFQQDE